MGSCSIGHAEQSARKAQQLTRALPDRLAELLDEERPRVVGPLLVRVLGRIGSQQDAGRWAGHDFYFCTTS